MQRIIKGTLACGLALALTACDEIAVAGDPALVEANPGAARALRTCPRAIARQTGASGITLNTDIVIVEINEYIFNVPGQERPWTCVTDDAGEAKFIYPTRVIQS